MFRLLKTIISSGDFCGNALSALAFYIFAPEPLLSKLVSNFYYVGMIMLAVAYAMYLARYYTVIFPTDARFVRSLQKKGDYKFLMTLLKHPLLVLPFLLGYGLLVGSYSMIDTGIFFHHTTWVAILIISVLYGLEITDLGLKTLFNYQLLKTTFLLHVEELEEEVTDF